MVLFLPGQKIKYRVVKLLVGCRCVEISWHPVIALCLYPHYLQVFSQNFFPPQQKKAVGGSKLY